MDKENLSEGERISVDIMKYFGDKKGNESTPESELSKLDSKVGKRIDKGMDIFFELEDKYNLSKTDILENVVFPLTQLIDFVRNPTPTYNSYIDGLTLLDFQRGGYKFKNKNIDEENLQNLKDSLKISCPELVKLITEIYVPALVSKNRQGRKEGKAVMHGLTELSKMVNEKLFGMSNPYGGMGQIEVDNK